MHLHFVLETASFLLLFAAKCSSFIPGDWHKFSNDSPQRSFPQLEGVLWEQPEISRELKELNCSDQNFIKGLYYKSSDISQVIINVRCNFEQKSFFAHSKLKFQEFDSDPTDIYTGDWQKGMRSTHPKVFSELKNYLMDDPSIKQKLFMYECDFAVLLEDMYYDLANITQFILVIKCNDEQKYLFTRMELVLGAKNKPKLEAFSKTFLEFTLWDNPEILIKLREANCSRKDFVETEYKAFSDPDKSVVVINCNSEQKLLFVYTVINIYASLNLTDLYVDYDIEADDLSMDFPLLVKMPAEKLPGYAQSLREDPIISGKLLNFKCEREDFLEAVYSERGKFKERLLFVNCDTGRTLLAVAPSLAYEGFDSNPIID